MHENDRLTFALVEMGQAQAVHIAIVRGKGKVGQPLQQLIGCAHGVGHPVWQHIRVSIG